MDRDLIVSPQDLNNDGRTAAQQDSAGGRMAIDQSRLFDPSPRFPLNRHDISSNHAASMEPVPRVIPSPRDPYLAKDYNSRPESRDPGSRDPSSLRYSFRPGPSVTDLDPRDSAEFRQSVRDDRPAYYFNWGDGREDSKGRSGVPP